MNTQLICQIVVETYSRGYELNIHTRIYHIHVHTLVCKLNNDNSIKIFIIIRGMCTTTVIKGAYTISMFHLIRVLFLYCIKLKPVVPVSHLMKCNATNQ